MSTPFRSRLTHTQAVILMVCVTFMWSIAGVVARQLEAAVRFEVTFWRSAFTLASLLLILPALRALRGAAPAEHAVEHTAIRRWLHRHWGLLPESGAFWISGVCWSIMFTAFMLALSFTSVANVLIIMALAPLMTALVARVTIGQRLPMRNWIAIVVAGGGIAYMYGRQMFEALSHPGLDATDLFVGSLIALCVPVAAAINWTVVQRSQSHGEKIDLVPSVMIGALLSSLATLPMALPFAATPHDLVWLAVLGLFQLAIPCLLSVVCARVLKAPEVSLLALLEVIFGILLAWLLANEVPGREVLQGGGLVIATLVVNELLGWHSRTGTPRIQTLTAESDVQSND